jgi:hypothetical protein
MAKKQHVTLHRFCNNINETVSCAVCNKTIGMRDHQLNGATGLAWLDPYNHSQYFFKDKKAGCYVCQSCLSEKRKQEIEKEKLDSIQKV